MQTEPVVGFIGQGWIGKHYADDFAARGFQVVRYALEEPYVENRDAIAECAIVFVAVPTPTTTGGFNLDIVRSVLPLIGEGRIAVIKSTLLPGSTEILQKEFPNICILHSPEFLRESTAAHDAANPERNIVGIPLDTKEHWQAANMVLGVLPKAPYAKVLPVRAAELIKYAGNSFLTMKVVYANMLYDMADALGVSYVEVRDAVAADPRIGASHLDPVKASGHSVVVGRGAGGHCFIKDMEAFRQLHDALLLDTEGANLLDAVIAKNNKLLVDSGKDLDLLASVYGTP
jgi:nucleotide sugar dehydrogenase